MLLYKRDHLYLMRKVSLSDFNKCMLSIFHPLEAKYGIIRC